MRANTMCHPQLTAAEPARSIRLCSRRFLISADLVNLVTESQMVRRKRFRRRAETPRGCARASARAWDCRKAKKVMEETRLAFLVDLWKLRGPRPGMLYSKDVTLRP